MTRRRYKAHIVEREILAAIAFYQARGAPPKAMRSAQPQRVCAEPGCPVLVAKGYCAAHATVRRVVHQRFQVGGGLYGRPWRRARATHLSEHPWCVGYQAAPDHAALATELDHRIPHRGDRALFWDRSNWQGLCDDCHGRKTADETLHARGSA